MTKISNGKLTAGQACTLVLKIRPCLFASDVELGVLSTARAEQGMLKKLIEQLIAHSSTTKETRPGILMPLGIAPRQHPFQVVIQPRGTRLSLYNARTAYLRLKQQGERE